MKRNMNEMIMNDWTGKNFIRAKNVCSCLLLTDKPPILLLRLLTSYVFFC